MFNSNILPNSAPLQDTKRWNLSDLGFDLSRSLKVKCDGVIGLSIWLPNDMLYIVTACLSLIRLAVIATQNVFYLLSLGSNYEKSKVHRMSSKWPSMLQAQEHPYMLNYYPRVPNFTPFYSTTARLLDKWAFWFLHRLQWWIWNFKNKFVKNRKLTISKMPNVILWGPLAGKFRTSLKTSGRDW